MRATRRAVAVAGVATTAFGSFPETDATGLALEALGSALDDAGLERAQVDGLITSRVPSYARLCELARIEPAFVWALPPHGRMSGVGLTAAVDAVAGGRAEVVALAYGNDGRSRRVFYGGSGWSEDQDLWQAWGMTSPGAEHALLFERHRHLYGTTSEQLAEVAVAFRSHAARNPQAVMREPIGVQDHQRSRYVVEPLHLLDYCLINDGGVALVVTTAERARDCRHGGVEVLAAATAGGLSSASFPPEDFWRAPMQACAEATFGATGLGPQDVDVAQIYDNFSPTVLFTLEGFGYCAPGEGGAFVEGGALALDGHLPTNTSGGHLSESYMQGWALNVEAVRQVRGTADGRQVRGARVAHYMCAAPICSSILYGEAS
jgi:acetyl-CoA acetyltransferase